MITNTKIYSFENKNKFYSIFLRICAQIMSTINNRVMQLIENECNNNKRLFSKKVGVAASVVENIVGTRGTKPSFTVLEKIVHAFAHISIGWLVTGNGDMLIADSSDIEPSKTFTLRTDRALCAQEVPLYDIAATAGLSSLFFDSSQQIPIDTIKIPNVPRCDGAIYVTGDSMYPLLKAGDIILYKQIQDIRNNIFWGEIYLISFDMDGDEFIAVKYIQKSEDKECIKLVSQNPHHSPVDIHLSCVRAMAMVKASIRFNTII